LAFGNARGIARINLCIDLLTHPNRLLIFELGKKNRAVEMIENGLFFGKFSLEFFVFFSLSMSHYKEGD